MIKIILNGKEKEFSTAPSLKSLIGEYCQGPQHVIAEVNGQIIKKQTWEITSLAQGDTIELVSMVGGG
jgi:thiamine biosynthesis protein ThiS